MDFFDTHVHLDGYPPDQVPALLGRARAAGVARILAVGVSVESSRQTVALATGHAGVVPAVGVHPMHLLAQLKSGELSELRALAAQPGVRAIGEIGLDDVDAVTPLDVQEEALAAQLKLARALRLVALWHLRGGVAIERGFAVLRRAGVPAPGAIYHYFTGDAALARRALDLGLTLSVGKPVTRAENAALRAAVPTIPLDRLVLETDSYPLPGRMTEPASVVEVARAVAELTGRYLEQVAEQTTENARRLLGI